MSPSELMQRQKHRQHLIEMVRRWLPTNVRPLFDELIKELK